MISISIAIPVHNGENYVMEAINSVLEQNYDNYELIIIDNASTDNTYKILKKIKHKKIKLYRNSTNIGSTRNFNKCIKKAKNDYFMLLSHDDYLLPGCLVNYVKAIKNSEAEMLYSAFHTVNKNKKIINSKKIHKTDKIFQRKELILELLDNPLGSQLCFYKTDILKKNVGYELDYGPFCDGALFLKAGLKVNKVYYLSDFMFCHRSHENQGQNAFLNFDLNTISEHWGIKLEKSFFIENSYNHSFFKYIKLLHKNVEKENIKNLYKRKIYAVILSSNLRSISIAMFRLRIYILREETKIFYMISKMLGIRNTLVLVLITILNYIIQKLKGSILVISK